ALDAGGAFFHRTVLAPGPTTYTVTATDALGNVTTQTRTVTGTQAVAGRIDYDLLSEARAFTAVYGRTSFDDAAEVLYADVQIQNTGTYALAGPVLVGVVGLSNLSVQVKGDGVTPAGIPYFDLSGVLTGGALAAGATSATRALAFYNPDRVPFSYQF